MTDHKTGRPPRTATARTTHITVKTSPDLKRQFIRRLNRLGITQEDWIEQKIREFLSTPEESS